MEQYREKAGLEDFHWHDLRPAFASHLVMGGVEHYTVSKLLGHHDVKMSTRSLSPRGLVHFKCYSTRKNELSKSQSVATVTANISR